jgi:hypothetical protein
VITKTAKVEQADETKQNAESTLTTNTYANIINVMMQNAEYTPTINA